MFDMLKLAYQTDITRVFTFMMARDASQRVYANVGVTEPHHSCSHHGQDPLKFANLVKIQTHFTKLFGNALSRPEQVTCSPLTRRRLLPSPHHGAASALR